MILFKCSMFDINKNFTQRIHHSSKNPLLLLGTSCRVVPCQFEALVDVPGACSAPGHSNFFEST